MSLRSQEDYIMASQDDALLAWLYETNTSHVQPDAQIDTRTAQTVPKAGDNTRSTTSVDEPTQNKAGFRCETCHKTFTRKFNLDNHLKAHANQRSFSCRVCGRSFVRRHDRETHARIHTGEKRFICFNPGPQAGCGRSFSRRSNFLRHMRSCKHASGPRGLGNAAAKFASLRETLNTRAESVNVVPENVSVKPNSSSPAADLIIDSPPDTGEIIQELEEVRTPTQVSIEARAPKFDQTLDDSDGSMHSDIPLDINSTHWRAAEATTRLIQQYQHLDVLQLSYCILNSLGLFCPSWIVPHSLCSLKWAATVARRVSGFSACGNRIMADPIPTVVSRCLSLHGVACGIVQEVFAPKKLEDWSKPPLSLADTWTSLFRSDAQRYLASSRRDSESVVSALAKTLLAWDTQTFGRIELLKTFQSASISLREWLVVNRIPIEEDLTQLRGTELGMVTKTGWRETSLWSSSMTLGTSAFRAGSYIGSMRSVGRSARIECGDVCCVLFGGRMPFILRPAGHFFRLVGVCYIHGAMDGEIVERMEAGELKEQLFELI